nr:MAG TPA: hypothetical protein [Caudoviricetes sp.]
MLPLRNLINSDKLQAHGLSIHVTFPPPETWGRIFVEQFRWVLQDVQVSR